MPIEGEEAEQSSHGSEATLAWHTEDAFHPCRGDYLGLVVLRNPDAVPTVFASVDSLDLEWNVRRVLFERRFLIAPDKEHLKGTIGGRAVMSEAPQELVPALFGDPESPYLCADKVYMRAVLGDGEAEAALTALEDELDAALTTIPAVDGDVFFIDNFRAVHGRPSFRPRYDGSDRWLKKVVVTRDLRQSRALRSGPTNRILSWSAW